MKYFGTDGIRGEANVTLTSQLAFKLGQSLVQLQSDTLVIGWDTRLSSDLLVHSVIAGALSVGLQVIKAGIVPTPALAFYALTHHLTGVMVTASHNPYHDNGLKVFHQGLKLTQEQEQLLEDAIDSEVNLSSQSIGRLIYVNPTPKEEYIDFMKQWITKTSLKIGLDMAHGALYEIAPILFKEVTPHLVVTANTPSGTNINDGVGATHMDHIQSVVKHHHLDLGFSYDGDGDRMLVVDHEGTLYDGDMIAYVIGTYLKSMNQLTKNTVVLTKMSNLGVIKKFKEKGISSILTDVGDKYILEELYTHGYALGSENSGHLILPSILKAGDGLLASLFLVKVLHETGKSLKELTKDVVYYPEKMINLRVKNKAIAKDTRVLTRVDQIKQELQGDGKVIVRASGTEALIRVSVSAPNVDTMNHYLNELVDLVTSLDI